MMMEEKSEKRWKKKKDEETKEITEVEIKIRSELEQE
jgi:hypothetical protein